MNYQEDIPLVLIQNSNYNYYCKPHYGPGVDSVSNKNEYQETFCG
jgi:hypothetical protein